MSGVVGVKYNKFGYVYYFDSDGEKLSIGDSVLIEADRIVDVAKVYIINKVLKENEIKGELKSIQRKATNADLEQYKKMNSDKEELIKTCQDRIKSFKLNMQIVDVARSFDGQKITIYFNAESRVDFRELVKDIAGIYHVRIELRQVYGKDDTKLIGGLGPCGEECCCARMKRNPLKVNLKMAKNQSLSLNPTNISGSCGKFMCCLAYENDFYVERAKELPTKNSKVKVEEGEGVVLSINSLSEKMKIRIEKDGNIDIIEKTVSDLKD